MRVDDTRVRRDREITINGLFYGGVFVQRCPLTAHGNIFASLNHIACLHYLREDFWDLRDN